MRQFIGLIHKDRDSDYGVSFPDLPGCISAGRTLEEARLAAQEALTLHIRGLQEDGETIPAPSTLDDIVADLENRDSVAVVTIAPDIVPRSLRVNVTIPEDVLGKIDRYAEAHGLTRSGFLTRAAKKVMEEA
jgi:predicted RNase H-like HicB family nuclease